MGSTAVMEDADDALLPEDEEGPMLMALPVRPQCLWTLDPAHAHNIRGGQVGAALPACFEKSRVACVACQRPGGARLHARTHMIPARGVAACCGWSGAGAEGDVQGAVAPGEGQNISAIRSLPAEAGLPGVSKVAMQDPSQYCSS